MENKGCLLFIAFFAAIIAIANCDDKKKQFNYKFEVLS